MVKPGTVSEKTCKVLDPKKCHPVDFSKVRKSYGNGPSTLKVHIKVRNFEQIKVLREGI